MLHQIRHEEMPQPIEHPEIISLALLMLPEHVDHLIECVKFFREQPGVVLDRLDCFLGLVRILHVRCENQPVVGQYE